MEGAGEFHPMRRGGTGEAGRFDGEADSRHEVDTEKTDELIHEQSAYSDALGSFLSNVQSCLV